MALPRVLHLCPLGGVTGALRSMQVLVAEMAQHGPTFALTLEDGPAAADLRQTGATVRSVFLEGKLPTGRLTRWWGVVATLRRAVREHQIQIIHCHSAQHMRYAWPAGRTTGAKVVCHHRELWRGAYAQAGLGHADRIIVISEAVRRSLPARWQAGTKLVYNAVAGPSAVPERRTATAEVCVGVAGRVVREKGQDLAIEAALQLMERFDFEVEVWGMPAGNGKGGFSGRLRMMVEAAAEPHRPRFHFEPMRSDMEEFYRRMDIVVVPSRCVEGMGRVAVEAMAWGCAVLVAGHGGLVEVVEHERTGLAFTPDDADDLGRQLERLLRDEALRSRLAAAGRAEYERRFQASAHAEAVEEVYRELLEDHRRHR